MARLHTRFSPPHAIPRCLPRTVGPRVEPRVRRPAAQVPQRLAVVAALLGGVSVTAGCGRTELELDGSSYDVAAARELTLVDESVVYVELVAPANSDARTGLYVLEDGKAEIDDVIASICPGETPELRLDATGDLPALEVWVDAELRAVIWN